MMKPSIPVVICLGIITKILIASSSATATNVEDAPLENACHPTPDSLSQVYIIAYGSLLNTESKNKTYPNTGINIPVNVTGFSRNFNCKGSPVGHSTTYLGADKGNANTSFNGAIFKLPNLESLLEFDKRESYYCRRPVPTENIQFLIEKTVNSQVEQDFPGDGAQFWIYLVKPEFVGWPTDLYPIVQTYVDVFLGGCIELESSYNMTGFKDACVTSTRGWEYPWVNDRLIPRRPFVNTPKALQIDKLIQSHFPHLFGKVAIEKEIRYNFFNSGVLNEARGLHFYILIVVSVKVVCITLNDSIY